MLVCELVAVTGTCQAVHLICVFACVLVCIVACCLLVCLIVCALACLFVFLSLFVCFSIWLVVPALPAQVASSFALLVGWVFAWLRF